MYKRQAREHLERTLGHPPSEEELAKHLQIHVKKFRKLQQMSTMVNVLSLDMLMDGDDESQSLQVPSKDTSSQPERAYLQGEVVQTLIKAVDSLKEKEKMVVSLYYVEELNMSQIAQVMDVSEPRISQIHSAAIRKLKTYMEKNL